MSTSSSPTGAAGLLALKASIFYSGYIKSSTLKWTAIALISIYIVPAQGIMGLLNLEKGVCRFCCFPTNEKHQNMSWPWHLFCYFRIDRTRSWKILVDNRCIYVYIYLYTYSIDGQNERERIILVSMVLYCLVIVRRFDVFC